MSQHLSLCSSQDDTMRNYPHCDCGENPPMPQTSKEKQEAFRARQAMLGNTEVRGIYAPPALHATIKELTQKLVSAEARARPIGRHKPEDKK